jgi:hypothetical protein
LGEFGRVAWRTGVGRIRAGGMGGARGEASRPKRRMPYRKHYGFILPKIPLSLSFSRITESLTCGLHYHLLPPLSPSLALQPDSCDLRANTAARRCSCSCPRRSCQSPSTTSSRQRCVTPRFLPPTSRTTVLPCAPRLLTPHHCRQRRSCPV